MAACGRRSDLVPDELAWRQFLAPPLLYQRRGVLCTAYAAGAAERRPVSQSSSTPWEPGHRGVRDPNWAFLTGCRPCASGRLLILSMAGLSMARAR
jgi:hypothetical protein